MKDLKQPDARQPIESMSVDGASVYPGKSIYEMAAERHAKEWRRPINPTPAEMLMPDPEPVEMPEQPATKKCKLLTEEALAERDRLNREAGARAALESAAKVAEAAIPPAHYHNGYETASRILKPVAASIRSIDVATLEEKE